MNQIKPFIENFGKQFFIGVLLIGTIISLKFIEAEKIISFIPLIVCFTLTILILFFYKNPKFDLSSSKWFGKIKFELETTSNALIYLKDFAHPDKAKEKHRDDILAIMTEFARLIYEYKENIKIMAYYPISQTGPLPTLWLKNKIMEFNSSITAERAQALVNNSVFILDKQPSSNKYSFYLFDNDKLLYSMKNDNQGYQYFSIELGNSIIPYFLATGFNNLKPI